MKTTPSFKLALSIKNPIKKFVETIFYFDKKCHYGWIKFIYSVSQVSAQSVLSFTKLASFQNFPERSIFFLKIWLKLFLLNLFTFLNDVILRFLSISQLRLIYTGKVFGEKHLKFCATIMPLLLAWTNLGDVTQIGSIIFVFVSQGGQTSSSGIIAAQN